MFGMSGTEMIIILVFALLLFGPQKLPEIAKMLGKGMREFQKATNDIRSTVEHEFNKMADLEPEPAKKPEPVVNRVLELKPAPGAVAAISPAPAAAPQPEAPAPKPGEEKSPS